MPVLLLLVLLQWQLILELIRPQALLPNRGVCFWLSCILLFPTLIMGIFSKKINKEGAIAGMICGIGFTMSHIIYFQFLTDSRIIGLESLRRDRICGNVHQFHHCLCGELANLLPHPKFRTWSKTHIPKGRKATGHRFYM